MVPPDRLYPGPLQTILGGHVPPASSTYAVTDTVTLPKSRQAKGVCKFTWRHLYNYIVTLSSPSMCMTVYA